MKTKKYWIWVIVSFSILVVLWPALQITGETSQSAKDKETDSILAALRKSALSYKAILANGKEVLQGLEGVHVLVEPMRPEIEKYGLTKQALQTDTELQLRQYGIKVLTFEEWLLTPGRPYLYINANAAIIEEIPVAVIRVQLKEEVLLLRKLKRVCTGVCTWQRASVVRAGLLRVRAKEIREHVKDLVSEFINDYLAANPKDHSTKKNGSVFDDFKPKNK